MGSTPLEIPASVLQLGCEMEFDDMCVNPYIDPYIGDSGYSLKPFAKPASQINTVWRQLTLKSSIFWFTAL
jgi:hypothetical protein